MLDITKLICDAISTGSIVDECNPEKSTELLSFIAEETLEGVSYTVDLEAIKSHIKALKHRRPESTNS